MQEIVVPEKLIPSGQHFAINWILTYCPLWQPSFNIRENWKHQGNNDRE